MTAPQNPRVTQADREAYLDIMIFPEFDAADIQAGHWDHTPIIQAFARHREAAEAASKAREAALVEALDGLLKIVDGRNFFTTEAYDKAAALTKEPDA